MRWIKGAGCALAALSMTCAAPAGAATLTDAQHVTVKTAAVSGTLRLTAVADGARTTLTARGTLSTRSAARIVVSRCGDVHCTKAKLKAVASKALKRGRSSPSVRWRTTTVARWRIQLRVGHGTLVSVVLHPATAAATPAPAAASTPAPLPAAGDVPAAVIRRIVADPGLVPAYDPAIPDATVRCDPARPVRVRATLPPGETIAIDGAPAVGGTVVRDVALQPGQSFAFVVDGTERHVVRCLPADFPLWSTQRSGRADVEWIAMTPTVNAAVTYAAIADRFGVPVWWTTSAEGPINDLEVLRDGTVAWGLAMGGAIGFARSFYEHVALDGTPLGHLATAGTGGAGADDHDVALLANGNALVEAYVTREHVDLSVLGGPADATVLDAEIQEVRPDGTVAWSWSSRDHIGVAESAGWPLASMQTVVDGDTAYDLVHLNSLEPLADGDVVISARHLDAVYRIRRSDGAVVWKLGGTPRAESLAFAGDPIAKLGGQHDARILPDGTLTVHDNGSGQARPPRAVRYAIDTGAGTATLLESVSDARVPGSFCCGSARRLAGGHWLVGWGGNGLATELRADGTPVLTLTMPAPVFSYRAVPVSSGVIDRTALRAGMDAQHPRAPGG
jgi:hypothetical protein